MVIPLVLFEHFHPRCAITMHQPAASQSTEILSKKLFWTAQQRNSFIVFRPQMQAVPSVWLTSTRSPPCFLIENKVFPWSDLSCARGTVFCSSSPCQRPSYSGVGKELALEHPLGLASWVPNEKGASPRRVLHQPSRSTTTGSIKQLLSSKPLISLRSTVFSQTRWG